MLLLKVQLPLAKTNTLYYHTLYDENNASPHLAIGQSFPDAIKSDLNMSKKELDEKFKLSY